MKVAVRYYTRSGNTKKLAEAIAKAANTQAKTIDQQLDSVTDVLFLGGSVYGGGVDKNLQAFIKTLDAKLVKKAVVFSTAAISESACPELQKLLQAQGIEVAKEEYHCRGKFTIMHRSRPNEQDLNAAQEFVKKIIQ